MIIEDLLAKRDMTKYRLAVQAGIPHATLNDICSGKTKLEKCSAETVYKLAKALGVSMELLTEGGIHQAEREQAFEYGLPDYLQHDLDASFTAASTWRRLATESLPPNTQTI